MFAAGIPCLFPCWLNGLCAIITCLRFSRSPPFARVLTSPFLSLFGLLCAESFSMQVQQTTLYVKEDVFSLSMLTRVNTTPAKCSGECGRKRGSKGGQNHLAQPFCCRNPPSANAGLHHVEKAGIRMFSSPQWL